MTLSEQERDAVRVALLLLIDALDYDKFKENLAAIERNDGVRNTLNHGQIYDLIDKI